MSCAWVFQSHLPSNHDPDFEPICSDSNGWAVVDGVFATLNAIGIIGAAGDDQIADDEKTAYILGGILGGIVHIASAASGTTWAGECRDARADFVARRRQQSAFEAEQARREAIRRDHAEREAAKQQREQEERERAAIAPRGYFCSSSPSDASVGFCVREKAECEKTRDLSIGALPDLTTCTLTETAFCIENLCFPSAAACEARRSRTSVEASCAEMK